MREARSCGDNHAAFRFTALSWRQVDGAPAVRAVLPAARGSIIDRDLADAGVEDCRKRAADS